MLQQGGADPFRNIMPLMEIWRGLSLISMRKKISLFCFLQGDRCTYSSGCHIFCIKYRDGCFADCANRVKGVSRSILPDDSPGYPCGINPHPLHQLFCSLSCEGDHSYLKVHSYLQSFPGNLCRAEQLFSGNLIFRS